MEFRLRSILRKWMEIGTSPEYLKAKNNKIYSLNKLIIIMLSMIVLSLLTNIINWSWTDFDTIFYPGCISIILLGGLANTKGNYRLSIMIIFISIDLLLMYTSIITGNKFLIALSYIINMLIVFFFFDELSYRFLFACFQIVLFSIVVYLILDVRIYSPEPKATTINTIIVYTLCYFLIFILAKLSGDMNVRSHFQKKKLLNSLQEKNKEIEDAYKGMEEFAYAISHDFKAPLRNMNGFAGLLSRDLAKGKTQNLEDYAKFIQDNSNKLSRMIDDVLSYSRLGSEQYGEKSVVDINKLLEYQSLQLKNMHPNAVFELEDIPPIQGNKSKLTMLFQNLMENGLKYNDKEQPLIRIESRSNGVNRYISIQDNGIGIDKEHEESIFQLFRRLHTDEEYEGTGIGLANCKKIVEDHLEGNIILESEKGAGSTFIISIPK